jgi:hypothetical protein
MLCEAKLHSSRVAGPALAVQLMRVDNVCRGEEKVVALCQTCFEADSYKIAKQYYRCPVCNDTHPFSSAWKMIGAV